MRIRINLDFELPPRLRRALLVGIPVGSLLLAPLAWASVPTIFEDGDILSAEKMNANFSSLDQRLMNLETLANKQTADGGFSLGARYCGATGNTSGSLSGLATGGTGYAKAKAQCATTCSSPTAHMCTGNELTRSAALASNAAPAGWFSAGTGGPGSYECLGWTSGASDYQGPLWGGGANQFPSANACNTSYPVLCCD
jgi:hypothetical protein